jgi:hypothetical protein
MVHQGLGRGLRWTTDIPTPPGVNSLLFLVNIKHLRYGVNITTQKRTSEQS